MSKDRPLVRGLRHNQHLKPGHQSVGLPASERVTLCSRQTTSAAILSSAFEYERRFGVTFTTFATYPVGLLRALHAEVGQNTFAARVRLFSDRHALDEISKIANMSKPKQEDRRAYLRLFLDTYRKMPLTNRSRPSLTAAPRREGMLLARELGWLPNDAFTPHLKRIPVQNDLVIGVEFLPTFSSGFVTGERKLCRIVDGAIATGATIITLMEIFSDLVEQFEIYTVHCTQESANALLHYAVALGKEITLYTGFMEGILNNEFYAVAAKDPDTLLVGDVGDMIAPILDNA